MHSQELISNRIHSRTAYYLHCDTRNNELIKGKTKSGIPDTQLHNFRDF